MLIDFGRQMKRLSDIVGAAAAGVVFSPVIALIVSRLANEDGGMLYKQSRIGRLGKRFDVIKFRSMVPNADLVLSDILKNNPECREEWAKDMKLKNDPRITEIGRFLRRTSLDELPQLINVIKGEMSLVGPRPIVDSELSLYGRSAKYYLSVNPGMTGLWQVSGRNNISYKRRIAMDRYYVVNRGIMLDAYILLKTLRVLYSNEGAY